MIVRRFRFLAAHPLTRAAALVALTVLGAACGAKVVVDGEGETGGGGLGVGGAGAGGSGGGVGGGGGLECGEEPAIGKIVAVCVSMGGGDFCPPAATSPGLLGELANAMGVCAQTSPGACCNQPALRQVVCDLPPSGNECCYHVHYFENVTCN